ncbi:M23 family metallopeptidase [Maricaulis sp.]|uniref:M23 family metallopeptidase n=1 Tax=unclassified Maricaulis TaxID=2632371 RepID=UPI001B08B98D|nr:M23 family metallopeptidase [Maricaulis sp.]MBO6796630.1 M23 family metallopeptidase [Maricaulis sp.]
MSRSTELTLAALVATAGIAAMIWWPPLDEGAEPADSPPAEEPAPEPEDPVEDPEPEPEPEPSVPLDDAGEEFAYMPPGDLTPDSGTGQTTQVNYAPGMRFPMEAAQAYANSQVYGYGGYLGPAGGQCNDNNYAYAWRDNFCETRGYSTPMCPSGTGHQGQDIRPATCQDAVHWAVAADDGTITSIGSYSVRLTTDDGVRYTYLHLEASSLQVSPGDRVTRGERLGFVSNEFNGTPTTIHLHFEIKMAVDTGSGIQNTNVPPYLALVDSYERLLNGTD